MAQVTLSVGGRGYNLACKDGEEQHLHALGEKLDAKVQEAISAIGHGNEVRLLLTGGLLLADELHETKAAAGGGSPAPEAVSASLDLSGLVNLAERLENLASSLEQSIA